MMPKAPSDSPQQGRAHAALEGSEPTRQQRRWLGAIAAERIAGKPLLARLGGAQGELDAWLSAEVREGRLRVVGPGEVALAEASEQLVLRVLAERGELEEIARATGRILEGRSVSDVSLALQWGDWDAFVKLLAARRTPRVGAYGEAEWLRRSVVPAFDAAWLRRTWGARTSFVVGRVLADALDGPSPCEPLYRWALDLPAEERADLEALLFQHALLRGEAYPAEGARRAAMQLVEGDLAGASRTLEAAFEGPLRHGNKRWTAQAYGVAAPPLALLAWSREDDAGRELGKRLIAAGAREAERAAARAFRTLERYLRQPTLAQRRIDVHAFGEDAPAWELLLNGFTVHLHLQQPWARASWAQRIAQRARRLGEAGYAWLAAQAMSLARALHEEYANKEAAGLPSARLPLWGLVEPKPDWQRTLEALAAASEAVVETAERTVRVAWFVDMVDGTLLRPALQEHHPGHGFGAGQRVSIGELWARRSELPEDDVRVLEHAREIPTARATSAGSADGRPGKRELSPEAWEALIGHPRVFDGARGMKPVAVVRGVCRVSTRHEPGYVQVLVEPEGLPARLGVIARPEDGRVTVYRVTPAIRKVMDAIPHGARIPNTHEAEVTKVLARLSEVVEVHSPALGALHEVPADDKPRLRFQPASGAWRVLLGVRPFGEEGRFLLAGEGVRTVNQLAGGRRLRCVRDFDAERAGRDAVLAASPLLARQDEDAPRDDAGWLLGEADVLSVLADLRASGVRAGLEWPDARALSLRGVVGTGTLHGKVHKLRGKKGWYLATGAVRLDDVTSISLGELLRAPPIGNGRFVRLPDGDYLEVEERIRSAMAALRARGSEELPAAAFEVFERVLEAGFAIDADVHALLDRRRANEARVFSLPSDLRATLREYQLAGYQWLCRMSELSLGVCLADDMGLGKTVQLIALLLHRQERGAALVVAPTSVCGNWIRELHRFAPSLRLHQWRPADGLRPDAELGPSDVLVCSYAVLQQHEAELTARPWATAVLDEAQFIKNPDSLRARAACKLKAEQRVALTGTPVENHYGDLWSIFHFLMPGLLGDFATFKRRYVQPIESGSGANASPVDSPEAMLRHLVQPFVLRRRKDDVLAELPPLTETLLEVELQEHDELRYGLLRKQIHDKLFTASGRRHSKLQILAELTRLRRFCCHPRLVFPEAEPESAKIRAFLDLAEELRENGHRALVFSQWVDFLTLVREQLDERGLRYEYLDGSTPAAARPARVDAFQHGDAPFFLISLKAGGFGLNLTGADYVIHLDPWWNPAVEAQATDRAHRIGQARPVTVVRLVTRHTIEEQIVELHQRKQRLARALLDESDGNVTADELMRILG
jgi:hypothetical protein